MYLIIKLINYLKILIYYSFGDCDSQMNSVDDGDNDVEDDD